MDHGGLLAERGQVAIELAEEWFLGGGGGAGGCGRVDVIEGEVADGRGDGCRVGVGVGDVGVVVDWVVLDVVVVCRFGVIGW